MFAKFCLRGFTKLLFHRSFHELHKKPDALIEAERESSMGNVLRKSGEMLTANPKIVYGGRDPSKGDFHIPIPRRISWVQEFAIMLQEQWLVLFFPITFLVSKFFIVVVLFVSCSFAIHERV
jgi:hypothetical protein